MDISLTAEQEAWFVEQVACGAYPTVEEAARQLLDERIAERRAERASEEEIGDLAWVRPLIDEAMAEYGRTGVAIPLEEHNARMRARIASFKA